MFNRNHGPLVFLLEAARIQGESAAPSGPMCLCSGIHHRPHQRVATGTSPLEVKNIITNSTMEGWPTICA